MLQDFPLEFPQQFFQGFSESVFVGFFTEPPFSIKKNLMWFVHESPQECFSNHCQSSCRNYSMTTAFLDCSKTFCWITSSPPLNFFQDFLLGFLQGLPLKIFLKFFLDALQMFRMGLFREFCYLNPAAASYRNSSGVSTCNRSVVNSFGGIP